jgi:hypothetical protein
VVILHFFDLGSVRRVRTQESGLYLGGNSVNYGKHAETTKLHGETTRSFLSIVSYIETTETIILITTGRLCDVSNARLARIFCHIASSYYVSVGFYIIN